VYLESEPRQGSKIQSWKYEDYTASCQPGICFLGPEGGSQKATLVVMALNKFHLYLLNFTRAVSCAGTSSVIFYCPLQGDVEKKMLTRIACSKLLQKKITRWRQEHEDWEALAAFALSKTTGRRFKNKPHSASNSVPDVVSSGETTVARTNVSDATAINASKQKRNNEISDSDSVTLDDRSQQTSSGAVKLSESKRVLNTSRHNEQAAESLQMKKPSDRCPSVSRSDVVVKQISLDELSDEELFLPPPDEETSESAREAALSSAGSKIASGFFVVSDEEDSGGECPATAAPAQTAASSSDTDDDGDDATSRSVLRSSVKLSTMFARSLSQRKSRNVDKRAGRDKKRSSVHQNPQQRLKERNRSDGKRFSDKPFTKSRGSFPNVHGSRYPKKNEKYSQGNAKMNTQYVELTLHVEIWVMRIGLFFLKNYASDFLMKFGTDVQ